VSVGELWPRPNLLAGYHLENVNDFSGNGHTLTNENSVTFTMGRFANCANFGNPNTNKGLFCSTDLGISIPNSAWSTELWLNVLATPASGVYYCLLGWWSQAGTKGLMKIYYYNAAGVPTLQVWTNNTAARIAFPITFDIGKWYYIAVTQSSGGALALYVNGALVGTGTHSTETATDARITLGYTHGVQPSSVMLDEVVWWSRQLSAIEIRRWFAWSKGLLNG